MPDVSITLRIYAHVIPNMQQVAADVMDGLFAGKCLQQQVTGRMLM
jgi:hypothetical protein